MCSPLRMTLVRLDGLALPRLLNSADLAGNIVCQLGIQGLDAGLDLWILGDPFLRKYYSVFE